MPKTITRDDLLVRLKMLHQDVDKEAMHRRDIEQSKDFKAVQADIDATEAVIRSLQDDTAAMRARQKEMLEVVSDSRLRLEETKRAIIQLMQLEGVEGYAEDWISVSGKFSEKRSVDGMRLLNALGGDVDAFISIVRPTQKALKMFADEQGDPAVRKEIMSCIKLDSRELVDVEISLPSAS